MPGCRPVIYWKKKMISGNIKVILSLIFRVVLAVVFINAAIEKITYPSEFAVAIDNYGIVPPLFTNTIAVILPWIEFLCGLTLLAGLWQRGSAVIMVVLLMVFAAALISVLMRGLEIDCGCFGTDSQVSVHRLLEDLLFLFMAIYLIKYPSYLFSADSMRTTG
jgi:putative oxidoreductase